MDTFICGTAALGGLIGVCLLAWLARLPGPQDTATIDRITKNRNVANFIRDFMKIFLLIMPSPNQRHSDLVLQRIFLQRSTLLFRDNLFEISSAFERAK